MRRSVLAADVVLGIADFFEAERLGSRHVHSLSGQSRRTHRPRKIDKTASRTLAHRLEVAPALIVVNLIAH